MSEQQEVKTHDDEVSAWNEQLERRLRQRDAVEHQRANAPKPKQQQKVSERRSDELKTRKRG